MKKKFLAGFVVGLFVLGILGISNAKAYTVYYDLTSFNVAVGATTTDDFESDTVGITYLSNGYYQTNAAGMIKTSSYSSDSNGHRDFGDFTIDATGTGIYMAGVRQQNDENNDIYFNSMNNTASMNVLFGQHITAFGFDWIAEGNQSYDHSTFTLLGTTYDFGVPGASGFFGVVMDSGETFSAGTPFSFGQDSSNWSGMSIDNITYSSIAPVPIPASILLFGSGLAGLVGIRSRRKKR